MRLKFLDLKLEWPESVPLKALRSYVIEKLSSYGDPLRWGITNISSTDSLRQLNIEAVVIIK